MGNNRAEVVAFLAMIFFLLAGAVAAGIGLAEKEETIEWLKSELEYQRQHCICPKLGEEI